MRLEAESQFICSIPLFFLIINTTAQFIVDITVKRVYGTYQQGD
jgi:hypothetical protein